MLTSRASGLIVISLSILLVFAGPIHSISGEENETAEIKSDHQEQIDQESRIGDSTLPTYIEWIAAAEVNHADAATATDDIVLAADSYTAVSADALFQTTEDNAVLWNSESGWIEWHVTIPMDGLYDIGIVYDSANTQGADIIRGLQVDGVYPYEEAQRLRLKRSFVQSPYPPKRDSFGNDQRPQSVEVKGWKLALFTDYDASLRPLKWFLSAGEHTIRLIGESQPLVIKEIRITAPKPTPKYINSENKKLSSDKQDGSWIQIIEAENATMKSNTSIQIQSTNAALISPSTEGYIRYNTMGGEQFSESGQWSEWDFEVPKDGVYQIGFKYLQAYLNNLYSYRSITIDGLPLFQELEKVGFPYSSKWDGLTLSDESGEPLDIYLTKGKHTLRTTAAAAPIKPIYEGIIRSMKQIADLESSIRKITGNFDKTYSTGGNIDINRDWMLEKYIPDLSDRINSVIAELGEQADDLKIISTSTSDVENSMRLAAEDLADMRDHPRDIPNELNKFAKMRSNLGIWLFRLTDQPLLFDYIWIAEPGAELPRVKSNFFENAMHSLVSFVRTFTIDYDFRRNEPKAIDVWVNRARDYVNLLQQLADETFTAQTGISVNVNIVPDPQMFVLGNAAGIQPDVALGLDNLMPVDFATRGALLDLSQFAGYHEAAEQFHPGALRVFHYNEGDYALPEIQEFNVLIYRTDILEALGLNPPDTWEELYKMLPTLQQNGYDFYLNPKDYLPFLYQHGAELYTEDGLSSALDSKEAYQGFLQWSEMFTLYQIPREVPSFYNHFRLGDIPIGVCDFNTYLQVMFAAPELAGKWRMAPLPGTMDENGVIERWAGGPMQSGVIFAKTEKKQDSWEFLKWWTSAQTQERFGNEIEALYGPEYRWNTANMQAFSKLPWPREHLEVIQGQKKWYKEAPQVPGGYLTPRQLGFVWNKVVLEKKSARESFEQGIIDINREMIRKQIEFGLRDKDNTILDELDVPALNDPWIGGGVQ